MNDHNKYELKCLKSHNQENKFISFKKINLEEMICDIFVCFEKETRFIIVCILQFKDPTFILY